jgi:acyl transferase domain-containing protein
VRRAAVSSFGVGGTNAHVILEDAPPPHTSDASKPWQVLTLSARSEAALAASSAALLQEMTRSPSTELADIAWSLQTGRHDFAFRRSVVCRDRADALCKLAQVTSDDSPRAHQHRGHVPSVVFMFPGQGAQYVGMTAGLLADEPSFRADVGNRDSNATLLGQARLAQPALFVTEWALARLLMRWGIRPDAMIGHSIGEHTAACLGGVTSVEATLSLIARRGRLIQSLPTGRMLVVHLPEDEAAALCDDNICLAAVNAPRLCVLAGPESDIAKLAERLLAKDVDHHVLHTSHAFHSRMMDPALADFTAELARHEVAPPRIPYLSGVTGTWITEAEAMSPDYFSRLLRGTVRFSDGLRTLAKLPNAVLVEVGPGKSLSMLARQHPELAAVPIVSTLRSSGEARSDREVLAQALGELWLHGARIDWNAVHHDQKRRRVPLPGHPFERRLHWVPRPPGRETNFLQPQSPGDGQPLTAPMTAEVSPEAVPAAPRPSPLRERLVDAAPSDRPSLLRAYLARTINAMLGHDSARPLEPEQSLADLGVDSLASIQLAEQLARDLGVSVPVRALLDSTIESLASTIGARLA